jgi:hypothetical protein
MAVVPELTKEELAAEIRDPEARAWVELWADLPASSPMSETLAKVLQAGFIAQQKKNAAAIAAAGDSGVAAGDLLNGFQQPVFGDTSLDINTGITSYQQSLTLIVRVGTSLDNTVPSRA